jgi:hypothetical protein
MESPATLMEVLHSLDDQRRAQGKRHPLAAILALATVAMLTGRTSYEAIAEFGRDHGWPLLQLLGFTRRKGPCKATFSRVFRGLGAAAVEQAIRTWLLGRVAPAEYRHITLDGKTARGSRDGQAPAAHLLTAYAPEVQAVLAQLRIDGKTNEHKAALELLGVLPLAGKVVTGDAMFTHRDFCETVLAGGGDYLLPVKENQPTLQADIEAAFTPPAAGLSPPPVPAP